MPNWGKLLSAFAEGGDPAAFARVRAQKEEAINNAQRRELLASAETRAQAEEGRRASDQRFQESQRPMLMDKLNQEVEAGRLSNASAQKLLNDFDRKVKAEEAAAARDERRVGFEGQRIGQEGQRIKIAEEAAKLNKRKTEQEMDFEGQIQPYRVAGAENASDPRQKYSSDLNALRGIYDSAVRSGDEETAAKVESSINRIMAQQEAESFAWNQRRNARIGGGAPQPLIGAAAAFKNAPKEKPDKKATPGITVAPGDPYKRFR